MGGGGIIKLVASQFSCGVNAHILHEGRTEKKTSRDFSLSLSQTHTLPATYTSIQTDFK